MNKRTRCGPLIELVHDRIHPINSPNLGVNILLKEPSLHGDEIKVSLYIPSRASATHVLPHEAATNFTPWCGVAVIH